MSAEQLAADLRAVSEVVSYLRAEVRPPEGEWLLCDELVSDPTELAAVVAATAEGRGTTDAQVAASLFAQAYAFRVAGVSLASWVLHRRVPDMAAGSVSIGISRNRPSTLAFREPRSAGLAGDTADIEVRFDSDDDLLDWLLSRLFAHHLDPFVDALRSSTQVGERLLWGNIATSCMVAFRAVEGAVAHVRREAVRADALAFLAAAPHALQTMGSFVVLEAGDRQGWFWERTNCCLWYQTSGGQRCADCSLVAPDERRAAFIAQLTGE